MPALACKTHKELFLCIWLPLFHPMENRKFNFFLSKYTVIASGGLWDLKTDHLEPLASHSFSRQMFFMNGIGCQLSAGITKLVPSVQCTARKAFWSCPLHLPIVPLMLLAWVDVLTNICWRLWEVTMYPLQFYRPTGSRTRTSAPRKCAPWSTKYRKTAPLTALACKLVN